MYRLLDFGERDQDGSPYADIPCIEIENDIALGFDPIPCARTATKAREDQKSFHACSADMSLAPPTAGLLPRICPADRYEEPFCQTPSPLSGSASL